MNHTIAGNIAIGAPGSQARAEANQSHFRTVLAEQYAILFKTDPEYAYSASQTTPDALALNMTAGLLTGRASKDGKAVKQACKALGIPCTYKAITPYLLGQ